jgi:hypothetical protein
MKSIEFLTEAEANIAQKKLDKYLDMLSDDNLRSLIPMLKSEVQMDEAVNPELYQRLAARKGQGSPIKVDSPKPVNKQPNSTTKTTADPEATKVQQVLGSLSASEKKELLSLLQKEAKTRPATNKKSTQKKSTQPADKKSPSLMKGCLLPIVGIIGLLSLIPDSPDNATDSSSISSVAQSTDVVEPFTYGDGATYYTIKVKSSPTDPNVKTYLGKRDGRSGISYSIYAVDLATGQGVNIKQGFQTDFEDESSAVSQFNNEIPLANTYSLTPGSTQHIRYQLLKDKF